MRQRQINVFQRPACNALREDINVLLIGENATSP